MIWAYAIFWATMMVFGVGVYFYSLKKEKKDERLNTTPRDTSSH
jgi:hypothetical protein